MTLWTPISRQKNKILTVLVCLLGLSLWGCTSKEEVIEEIYPDLTVFFGKKVSAETYTLYNEEEEPVITVLNSGYVCLSNEGFKKYVRLSDSSYYVNVEEVEANVYDFTLYNHLIPFNKEIRVKKDAILTDESYKEYFRLEQEMTFPVYVDKTEKKGILFQDRIFFVKNEDVLEEIVLGEDPKTADKVSVLMYHFFYDEDTEDMIDTNYTSKQKFGEQLDYLNDNGYATLKMRELQYYLNSEAIIPEKSVVISMDDGNPSVYEYAFPLIRDHKMNATSFLVCGWLPAQIPWDYLEMKFAGVELQSHSFLMHEGGCSLGHGGKLLCTDHDAGVEDTTLSIWYCDGAFVYCYPFGDYNDEAISIIRDAGIEMAFTTEPGQVRPGDDMFTLPRVRVSGDESLEQFIASIQ